MELPGPLTEQKIYTLDGGVGTELVRRGADMDLKVWCGRAGFDNQALLENGS